MDGATGFLVDYAPIDGDDTRNNLTVRGFADAIAKVLLDPEKARIMGNSGRERVHELFGMETFRKQWWGLLNETEKRGNAQMFEDELILSEADPHPNKCVFELVVVLLDWR